MIFGIGGLQEGINESDDRYQTKRLNNLRAYQTWRELFPTASMSDHQNFINNLAGGDRYLRGQLPSVEAIEAYDKERKRKRKLAEEERQFQRVTRQLQMDTSMNQMIDELATKGVGVDDIESTILGRFAPDSELRKMFETKFSSNRPALNARVNLAAQNHATKIYNILKDVTDAKERQSILESFGIKKDSTINKIVTAKTVAFNNEKKRKRLQEARPTITKSQLVIGSAMSGDKAQTVAKIKQTGELLGIQIDEVNASRMADEAIAAATSNATGFVNNALKGLSPQMQLAAAKYQNEGQTEQEIRAYLNGSIGSDVPGVLRERILDTAMDLVVSGVETKQLAAAQKADAEVGTKAATAVDKLLEVSTKDALRKDIAIPQQYLIKAGDDGMAEEADPGTKTKPGNDLHNARQRLIGQIDGLLGQGAQISHIQQAIEELRREDVGKKATLWSDIDEKLIKDTMAAQGNPYDRASMIVHKRKELTKNILRPVSIEDFSRDAFDIIFKSERELERVGQTAKDPSVNPALYKQYVKNAITNTQNLISAIRKKAKNKGYISGREKGDLAVIEEQLQRLEQKVITLQNSKSQITINNELKAKQFMDLASGGTGDPRAYRAQIMQELGIVQKEFLQGTGLFSAIRTSPGRVFQKARQQELFKLPGYGSLEYILKDRPTSQNIRKFEAELKRIIANKQKLIAESEDYENQAKGLMNK